MTISDFSYRATLARDTEYVTLGFIDKPVIGEVIYWSGMQWTVISRI